jgi:4-hydroxythreonine-4-phosphate dehydrogenase
VAVLGLNPHAGDAGVLGSEEMIIQKAIDNAHQTLSSAIFTSPLVPDVAFTPNVRKNYTHYIAMYHDQGLAPLKALYFDEGINVSLNLPILRTSVDHGTAFDIAYKKIKLNNLSYINAIKYIVDH